MFASGESSSKRDDNLTIPKTDFASNKTSTQYPPTAYANASIINVIAALHYSLETWINLKLFSKFVYNILLLCPEAFTFYTLLFSQ